MVIIFVIIGVLLFVCGIAFLFKGYAAIPASDTVVPREDFEKLNKDLESARGEGNGLKRQLDTLAIELEQTKVKFQEAQKSKETVKQLQALDEQNKTKIRELDERIGFFMTKAENQAKDAVEVIKTLTQENEDLKKQAQEAAAKAVAVDPEITRSIEEKTMKIQQLENDLAASQKLQEELAALKSNVDTLTQENQKLKEDMTTLAAKPADPASENELLQTKQAFEKLQQEYQALQTKAEEKPTGGAADSKTAEELKAQLDQKEARISELEKELQNQPHAAASESAQSPRMDKELARLQQEGEKQLAHSSAKIDHMQSENQELSKSVKALGLEILRLEGDLGRFRQEKERDDASRSLEREMELKRLCNDLKLQIDNLGRTIDGLKDENKTLLERQRHIEQGVAPREMTAKNLLADMQRVEGKPTEYEPWSQEKKQLEQHLRQLKDFNTHLLEKEKMIQMELTKSRTQAKGLEKICEEFKRQLEKSNRP